MPGTSPGHSPQVTTATETASQPQLLFFHSVASGSSRRTEAFLAQVLQRRRNHHAFRLRRIDADQHPELVRRLKVSAVPALLVVEDKRVRARLERPRGCADIARALAPWLS